MTSSIPALAGIVLLAALLGAPGAASAAGCSAYAGKVTINEIRVASSNKSSSSNRVELYNPTAVPQSVWSTWQLVVYTKSASGTTATKKGGYALSSGMTSSGAFLYNSSKSIYLRNRNGYYADVAVVDAAGDFIDYAAIEGRIQTVPSCLGTPAVVNATSSSDKTGDLARLPDGGAWPAAVTNSSTHTIGVSNSCTASGPDLALNLEADNLSPIVNVTTVTYTLTATNNGCTNGISGLTIADTGFSTANFSGTSASASQGSTSQGASVLSWNVGSLGPGSTATLTLSGKPKAVGTLVTTVTVSSGAGGLVNTGDDSDTVSLSVTDYNYVRFDLATDTVTEGKDASYSAGISSNVVPTGRITVNYTVSGTAGATDTDLAASGSVVIDPADAASPNATSIDFAIRDDLVLEPTKTIVLTITGVTSSDTNVRLDSAGRTMTITLLDDDTVPDHYEVSLPSSSLACLPSTVRVTACATATSPCVSPFTAASGTTATLSTAGATLGATTVVFDATGVATTTLSYPAAAHGTAVSVALSGEQLAGANPRRCCPDGVSCSAAASCSTTFRTAGFVIAAAANGASATLPTQTAGTASGSYVLRAVQSGTSTKACEAALTGTSSVNWAAQCHNPATCSSGNRMTLTGNAATPIAGNPGSGVSSTTAVAMTFDANGNAPFSFSYADVGQVMLHASKPAGGSLLAPLSGSSNAFVVKPGGFTLSVIRCSSYAAGACATSAIASPGLNPGASSATGAAFIPAGQPFTATVTAVDSAGNATPNYGREIVAEGVKLTASLVLPAGGNAPALANASSFGSFSAGAATGTAFSWPEVGIISLTPSVADGDYLGVGDVSGSASGNVGRFIPHHFDVTSAAACGSFSHAGQAFTATVTARNGLTPAGTTLNYGGGSSGFAKAVTLGDAGLAAGSFGAGATVSASAFASGVASASPSYAFTDKLTGPKTLTVRAVDVDGVSSSGFAEGSMPLRSSRLRVADGYGSEKSALQLAVWVEYWSAASWVLNAEDSCTTVPAGAVALSNVRGPGGSAGAWSTSGGAVTVTGGRGTLTLAAPSPAGTGSVDLALNLGDSATDQSCQSGHPSSSPARLSWLRSRFGACASTWDRDPSARASFGIHSPESRRTTHVREMF